jgi:hypothetical protein
MSLVELEIVVAQLERLNGLQRVGHLEQARQKYLTGLVCPSNKQS